MRIFLWLSGSVLLVYLLLCAALFLRQRSLIYFPQPAALRPAAATLELTVPGAQLKIAHRGHEGRKALIYFGGNAEDVSASLAPFAETFPDRSLYLLHYRGFGGSSDVPTEENLRLDALALFDLVQAKHPDITVIGRSLGSGVAVRLASQRPVQRLALVTPYASIEGLAAALYPWIPVRWLLTDKFDSSRYAATVKVPTLLLAAQHDEMIPASSTQRLLESFPAGAASLLVLPGTGHNTILDSPQYLEALRAAL